eukprot:scaffold1052_cov198-Alexandrium_tamarense.AAC.29
MAQVQPQHDCSTTTTTYQPLLDPESSLMVFLAEPAITTVTFFKNGDVKQSFDWLKDRLTLICKANPWLTGRLVKNKKIHTNLLLATPQPVTEEDVDAILCNDENVLSELSEINSNTKYDVLVEKLLKSKAVVGPGYKLIGKDSRVARFTLFPAAEGQMVLVFSMTHAVSDGFTYYSILSMLSGEIEELSSIRKHDFVPASLDAIGRKEEKYMKSTSFLICCIRSMMCGSKAKIDTRFVDTDKIVKWKESVKVGFISTNDIITSTFAQATRSDIMLMAINLRNKVKEADDTDAGNYELAIVHDAKSSAKPQLIRQTLQEGPPFNRKGDKALPGFFKTIGCKVSMITNWAFPQFKANLKLFDANGVKDIPIHLHLPIYNPKDIAFPLAIVFKPCAGRLAVMYGGSPRVLNYDRLREVEAPVGEQVNSSMFPID